MVPEKLPNGRSIGAQQLNSGENRYDLTVSISKAALGSHLSTSQPSLISPRTRCGSGKLAALLGGDCRIGAGNQSEK
jgi:hypothetical protein